GALGAGHAVRPGAGPGTAVRPVVGRGQGREIGPACRTVPHRDGLPEAEDHTCHHAQHGDPSHAPHGRRTTVRPPAPVPRGCPAVSSSPAPLRRPFVPRLRSAALVPPAESPVLTPRALRHGSSPPFPPRPPRPPP